MGKRTFAKAPPIDDQSGLKTKPEDDPTIEPTITRLSNQVAGQKNIFTRNKLINVDTIEPQTEPTPVKVTRLTSIVRFSIQKAILNNGTIYHNV